MSSLKMYAKIVTESCRILFENSIKRGEILARHLKINFAQKPRRLQIFWRDKFIAIYMYTYLAANGAALTGLVITIQQLFHSKL
jgi:hypothetical protein